MQRGYTEPSRMHPAVVIQIGFCLKLQIRGNDPSRMYREDLGDIVHKEFNIYPDSFKLDPIGFYVPSPAMKYTCLGSL